LYPWICLLLTTLTLWYPAGIRGKKMHSCESFTIQLKSPRLQAFTNTTYHFCCGQNKCLQGKKKCFIGSITSNRSVKGGGSKGPAFGWGLWSLMAVGMGQCDIPGTANWATALLILTLHLHIQNLKSSSYLLY
jgi:hypothetical protein